MARAPATVTSRTVMKNRGRAPMPDLGGSLPEIMTLSLVACDFLPSHSSAFLSLVGEDVHIRIVMNIRESLIEMNITVAKAG